MPQLMSHRDGFGWNTPPVANMLTLPPSRSHQTGKLRGIGSELLRRFAEAGTPVRLNTISARSSHTRYLLHPDKKNDGAAVTIADLQASFTEIIPTLEGVERAQLLENANGEIVLLIRLHENTSPALRELLEQPRFVDAAPYTTIALGLDSQQEIVLADITETPHIWIEGNSGSAVQTQLSILLTLMLFNSPSYLRVAIVSGTSTIYQSLVGSPHILGSLVSQTVDVRRLLDGLLKHIEQRRRMMKKQAVTRIYDYNRLALTNKKLKPLPEILLLMDVNSLPDWNEQQNQWLVPLHQVLNKGAEVGVHVVLNHAAPPPERLRKLLPVYLNLNVDSYAEGVPSEFVDGLLSLPSGDIPIELPQVQEQEIISITTYWQNMRIRRNTERENKGQPLSTGDTGLLTLRHDMLPDGEAPPTPPKPQTATLPEHTTSVTPSTQSSQPPMMLDDRVNAARALAAYLGWLGVNPLQDVLGMTTDEAHETIRILHKLGFLEDSEGPIWRFARLAEPPSGT